MAEFSAVKSQVLSELMPNASNVTSLNTAVSNAIIAAVKFYQPHKFTFNKENVNISFIPGIETYSVTSTFISMYRLYVNDSGKRIEMIKKPISFIQSNNVDTNYRGVPIYYGVFNQTQISISPYSRTTATGTAYFHSKLSDLAAGGSVENEWLITGQDLIKSRAKITIAENVIRDYGYATNLRIQEQEILNNLRLTYDTQIKSNYIENYYYNHNYYY